MGGPPERLGMRLPKRMVLTVITGQYLSLTTEEAFQLDDPVDIGGGIYIAE